MAGDQNATPDMNDVARIANYLARTRFRGVMTSDEMLGDVWVAVQECLTKGVARRSWIRCAYYRIVDGLRVYQKRQDVKQWVKVEGLGTREPEVYDSDPYDTTIAAWISTTHIRRLAGLTMLQRVLIYLNRVEGMSQAAAGECLGLNQSRVSQLINQGVDAICEYVYGAKIDVLD